jgi:hypothetical protein
VQRCLLRHGVCGRSVHRNAAITSDYRVTYTVPGQQPAWVLIVSIRKSQVQCSNCGAHDWRSSGRLGSSSKMGVRVRRRDFITLVTGAAVTGCSVARAQLAPIPVVGFLSGGTAEEDYHLIAAFRRGLREAGYVEGENVTIEYRFAEKRPERLSQLVTDLVARPVSAIAAPFYGSTALAAKAATETIPIIFSIGSDPVALGLVASLARPGGNVTGITGLSTGLLSKRLSLFRELLPQAVRLAVLIHPKLNQSAIADLEGASRVLGKHIEIINTARKSISTRLLQRSQKCVSTGSWSPTIHCFLYIAA